MKKTLFRRRNIISLCSLIITLICIIIIGSLNILPNKYYYIFIVLFLLFNVIGIIFNNLNGKVIRIIGIIVLLLIIIFSIFLCYFMKTTDNFIINNTSNYNNTFTYKYFLISNNNYNDIHGINVSYYNDILYSEDALSKLNDYNFEFKSYDDFNLMMDDLSNKVIDLVLIDESTYNMINSFYDYEFNIVYEFSISKEDKLEVKEFDKVVNIYIAGKDFTNINNDFNMVVSLDLINRTILFTGMPRDYYIPVYGKNGRRDTLSYMGAYGVNTSIKSLEELLSIKIDYYIEINTKSLVGLVDTLDGITYCSNEAFVTTHALVLDTYNDNGKKLNVVEGCQKLNGIETLTLARERLNITGGDTQRQINCYKIMMAIFDKMKSVSTIFNYQEVLNSVGSLYKTNIPANSIKKTIKDILDNDWSINYYELDGRDTKSYVHLTNYIDWVMMPDVNTINKFKELIKE